MKKIRARDDLQMMVLLSAAHRSIFPIMRVSLIVALLCTLLPVLALADSTVPTLMAQAQRAYVAGDYDTATELFTQVLQSDPQNTLAIRFLRTIRLREAGMAPAAKDPLKELILPKVELKDATFSAALDFFKHEAAAQSVTVSFVSQLPASQMGNTITLSLSQIPFLDALKYLCDLNNAAYKVERYAIVIVPVSATASPSPTPASQ